MVVGYSGRNDLPRKICARIDYVNGLQEELQGQPGAIQEVHDEFKALVEQCRTALRSRAEEND